MANAGGLRNGIPHIVMHPHEKAAFELAFVIEDPCGNTALTLAYEIIRLIAGRDEVTVLALLGEIRALQFKFRRGPRDNGWEKP